MSDCRKEKINCPECGKEFEFTLWNSVNTVINPEMKAKVRSGEIFRYVCPHCGSKVTLSYPMLYHQMEDRVMIWFAPNDTVKAIEALQCTPAGMGEMFSDFVTQYKKRVVSSINDLREKLAILDAGLDDCAIEFMKAFGRAQLEQELPGREIQAFFFAVAKDGTQYFEVHLSGQEMRCLVFNREMYDGVVDRILPLLETDAPVVDFNWALRQIQRLGASEEES